MNNFELHKKAQAISDSYSDYQISRILLIIAEKNNIKDKDLFALLNRVKLDF